ncbi:MAG: CoA transferase [Chloroflexota bacterium]
MRRPLEGIRVVEVAMFHAGPGAGAILGDLGAEVIKIEEPGTGDPVRSAKRVGSINMELPGGGSIWYEASNRSKKSVTIDLNKDKGTEVLYRLVGKSDVFITSFRRPAVERMKLSYSVLSQMNPKLIYAHISGFGPKGPDRDLGAFDYQGQGRSGMMFSVGEPHMTPLVSQFGLVDQATSIMASQAIMTALLMRERFGIGQEVHVSILGSALYLLYANVLVAQVGGFEVPRHQRLGENPLRNYYKCADDRWLIMSAPPWGRYWSALCQAIGRPDLENDPRFDTDDKRVANPGLLTALLDQAFASCPRQEWLETLAKYDIPAAPVHRLLELGQDPQIAENDYIVGFEHPRLGNIKIPGYPIGFSQASAGTRSAAPELGEHTEEVLAGICGYSQDEVAGLRAEGII